MQYEPKYIVTLQGQHFSLTRSQIEFDGPNYFTACFLGEFKEAQTRHLELNRDPGLFSLISTHMCGYRILPLEVGTLVGTRVSSSLASRSKVILNLRADALFYQLDGLVQACDDYIKLLGIRDPPKNDYLVVGAEFRRGEILESHPWKTRTTDPPLENLKTPESMKGFKGLGKVAMMEKFAELSVDDYSPRRYRFVGWSSKRVIHKGDEDEDDEVRNEVMVILEDLETCNSYGY